MNPRPRGYEPRELPLLHPASLQITLHTILLHYKVMPVKKMIPFYEDQLQLNQKVEQALRYYELPEEVTVPMLQSWINETKSPINFITRVFNEAYFESEIEAEKLLDLLTRLWNVTPRVELDGLSPQQKLGLFSRGNDE